MERSKDWIDEAEGDLKHAENNLAPREVSMSRQNQGGL